MMYSYCITERNARTACNAERMHSAECLALALVNV